MSFSRSPRDFYLLDVTWVNEATLSVLWSRRTHNKTVLSLCSEEHGWTCEKVSGKRRWWRGRISMSLSFGQKERWWMCERFYHTIRQLTETKRACLFPSFQQSIHDSTEFLACWFLSRFCQRTRKKNSRFTHWFHCFLLFRFFLSQLLDEHLPIPKGWLSITEAPIFAEDYYFMKLPVADGAAGSFDQVAMIYFEGNKRYWLTHGQNVVTKLLYYRPDLHTL